MNSVGLCFCHPPPPLLLSSLFWSFGFALRWPHSGLAFEYWSNCLFFWQTHTSQAVRVNPNLADFVSALFPVPDIWSIRKTLTPPLMCECVPASTPLNAGCFFFVWRISRYFHKPDLSLWSCTKTNIAYAPQRGREVSIALCMPFQMGSVSSVTVMILGPVMALHPIYFMTSDNTSVFLHLEPHYCIC